MKYLTLALIILSSACSSPQESTQSKNEDASDQWTPTSWVEDRVEASRMRLMATDAGKMVWSAIEAHGGLKQWFANGPISFKFDYQPLGDGLRRHSSQVVDQWSVRSVHQLVNNADVKFGWDGENAWTLSDTTEVKINPRFWSNTPFYFIALPFVLADEGTVHTYLGEQELEGKTYDLVKTTYEAGTGDAPDDFYVIYIDKETKRLGALRYVVSYPGFFPDGGHSPEKIMKITGLQEVDGIYLPEGYETYWWKDDAAGEHITNITVNDVSFSNDYTEDFFDAPEGAEIQEGY